MLVKMQRKWNSLTQLVGVQAHRATLELSIAMIWMELEGITPRKVNQSEKDNYHMISLICGI